MKARAISVKTFLLVATLMAPALCAPANPETPSNEARTERYFQSIRKDPNRLLVFLREMPKGGDLHNHLLGAIYAESFIQWASENGLCVHRKTMFISPPPCDGEKSTVPVGSALSD